MVSGSLLNVFAQAQRDPIYRETAADPDEWLKELMRSCIGMSLWMTDLPLMREPTNRPTRAQLSLTAISSRIVVICMLSTRRSWPQRRLQYVRLENGGTMQ